MILSESQEINDLWRWHESLRVLKTGIMVLNYIHNIQLLQILKNHGPLDLNFSFVSTFYLKKKWDKNIFVICFDFIHLKQEHMLNTVISDYILPKHFFF